jgi:predicted dehydrogenase
MKFLVIGLGSMGKRRIRNLLALGQNKIVGVDPKMSRIEQAKQLFEIEAFSSVNEIEDLSSFSAFIISVPPDIHHIYLDLALKLKTPSFVEASVVDTNLAKFELLSKTENVLIAPSCTLFFHPAIKLIQHLVKTGDLGQITNVIYHSGQYLPDWHVYESPAEYYVSNPITGGAREIVPFELTWLTKVFGFPKEVCAIYKKTIDIAGAELINDTYNILLDYPKFIINLNVDVVSRVGTRKLTINGSNKQLVWNWDSNGINLFNPDINEWSTISYSLQEAEMGYNKNISEQMYIDEVSSFLNAISGDSEFPNDLAHDISVLNLLYSAEKSYLNKCFVEL